MARLIVYPGTSSPWEIRLKDGINTLGRSEANDAVINDPSISGRHCEVIVSAEVVRLKDLGSTNGTFVNRVLVTEALLQPGQSLQLGNVEMLFEMGDGLPVASAPAPGLVIAQPPRPPIALKPTFAVRIAAPTPEPAAASAPPEFETDPADWRPIPAVPAPINAKCKYHPRTSARWLCPQCHKTYCDLCVTTRPAVGMEQKFCRTCGVPCAPLQVRMEAPTKTTFFRELPRSILYPFRGAGFLILIVAMLLFAALDVISRGLLGLFMKAVALGYLFSYVQNIIHSTASDDDQMPELPGMDDVLGGFFRLLGTTLISFGPAIALAYLAIVHEQPAAAIALIPAVIFGCLYFPMAFLAVAIKDNVMAANPLIVVPAILRVPLEYIVTAVLLGVVFAVRWIGNTVSAGMAHQSLMTSSMTEMFLLFGFRAFWAFVSVYLLTVTVRILGLLYRTKRDRLGW